MQKRLDTRNIISYLCVILLIKQNIMMSKVLEFLEKSIQGKSDKFVEKMNVQKLDTDETLDKGYNPKTARVRSLKEVFEFSQN